MSRYITYNELLESENQIIDGVTVSRDPHGNIICIGPRSTMWVAVPVGYTIACNAGKVFVVSPPFLIVNELYRALRELKLPKNLLEFVNDITEYTGRHKSENTPHMQFIYEDTNYGKTLLKIKCLSKTNPQVLTEELLSVIKPYVCTVNSESAKIKEPLFDEFD